MLVKCPSCSKQLNVPDSAAGKKAKCPACTNVFEIAAPSAVAASPPAPKPPPPPPVRQEVEEERPRRRARDDDDEEDEDRPRRRPRDEEDEDDRPRRRSRNDDDMDEDEDYDDEPRGRSRIGGGNVSGKITSVGVINIVLGSLVTLGSLCFLIFGVLFASAANDFKNMPNVGNVPNAKAGAGLLAAGGAILVIIGLLILLFGVGQIMAGVGVLKRRQWGRILTVVVGGFYCLFAVFSLWVFVNTLSLPAGWPGKTWSLFMWFLGFVLEVAYAVLAFTVMLNRRYASTFH